MTINDFLPEDEQIKIPEPQTNIEDDNRIKTYEVHCVISDIWIVEVEAHDRDEAESIARSNWSDGDRCGEYDFADIDEVNEIKQDA